MRDLELEAPARPASGMRTCVLLTGFYLLGLLPAAPLALNYKGLRTVTPMYSKPYV